MSVDDLTVLISQHLPEPHAGLLSGILFGTKAALTDELHTALITTGTLHIVALSGMNISIVASLVGLFLVRIFSRRISTLLTIFIIIGYIWFVGPGPSIIRAGIMGCLSLLALVFGKQVWALWFWILAVIAMLLLNPLWIVDLSFLLSVFATLGLLLFGGAGKFGIESQKNIDISIQNDTHEAISQPPDNLFGSSIFRAVLGFLREDLHVTFAAQVFTVPIILIAFHRVSLIAPLANVLIGWIIGPLTVSGFLLVFAALLFEPLGRLIALITWVPLQYILTVIMILSRVPYASLDF